MNILIVDDEEDILEILEMSLEIEGDFEISSATSGNLAIEKLKKTNFDLVICDYNMRDGNGGDVYRFLLNEEIETKYVLCSSEDPQRHEVFNDRRYFFFHIDKPLIMDGVKNCIKKMSSNHISIPLQKSEFVPVSIKILHKLDLLPADIYLKVNSEKYLKILNLNDTFDEVDFVKYVQKNIFKLYIKLECAPIFQEAIEKNILLNLNKIQKEQNLEKKAEGLLDAHGQILSVIGEYGLSGSVKLAAEQSNLIAQEMIQDSKELDMLFNKILNNSNSYLSKHSFLLSALTIMLVEKLGWSNTMMNNKLVAASLFHDVALKEDLNESIYQLKGKQSEEFRNHSQVAAEIINQIPSIPAQTDVIILEHHEVGPGEGFPRGLPFSRISPLGLVFSFTHYFVDYLVEYASVKKALNEMQPISEKCSQYRSFYKALCELKLSA